MLLKCTNQKLQREKNAQAPALENTFPKNSKTKQVADEREIFGGRTPVRCDSGVALEEERLIYMVMDAFSLLLLVFLPLMPFLSVHLLQEGTSESGDNDDCKVGEW